jgi:hypothetical protein
MQASVVGKKAQKSTHYFFICFATKAMHLEVTDLTTATLIAPLKRFMDRCGKYAHICSDSVTHFIRAQQEMKGLTRYISQSFIKIRFKQIYQTV